jgi:hypothetical protein
MKRGDFCKQGVGSTNCVFIPVLVPVSHEMVAVSCWARLTAMKLGELALEAGEGGLLVCLLRIYNTSQSITRFSSWRGHPHAGTCTSATIIEGKTGYNYELPMSGLSARWLVPGRVSILNMYCIVLYCIVLYCIVLYCIVLYCIVLYCIAFGFALLFCVAVSKCRQQLNSGRMSLCGIAHCNEAGRAGPEGRRVG